MNLDYLLRGATILIFVLVRIYWYKAKLKSNLEKHKNQSKPITFEKIGIILGAFITGINLLGFTIFTFESIIIQSLGFVFVILGSSEAVLGRFALGNNWTESYEYQIKRKHKLVTDGLYKFVRHPIYGGFMIAVIGAFMVAETYLFIPLFFFLFILMTKLAKREEKLLINYFGRKYRVFMQESKMFLPFIY